MFRQFMMKRVNEKRLNFAVVDDAVVVLWLVEVSELVCFFSLVSKFVAMSLKTVSGLGYGGSSTTTCDSVGPVFFKRKHRRYEQALIGMSVFLTKHKDDVAWMSETILQGWYDNL